MIGLNRLKKILFPVGIFIQFDGTHRRAGQLRLKVIQIEIDSRWLSVRRANVAFLQLSKKKYSNSVWNM